VGQGVSARATAAIVIRSAILYRPGRMEMSESGNPQRARRHPAAFLLWGWAMLLVVLLSAAPTGGPPRTRLLGSAFDPATVSVVVSPKKPRLDSSTSSASKRKLPETASAALLASAVIPSPAHEPLPRSQRPWRSGEGPVAVQRPLARAHGARAPPLA